MNNRVTEIREYVVAGRHTSGGDTRQEAAQYATEPFPFAIGILDETQAHDIRLRVGTGQNSGSFAYLLHDDFSEYLSQVQYKGSVRGTADGFIFKFPDRDEETADAHTKPYPFKLTKLDTSTLPGLEVSLGRGTQAGVEFQLTPAQYSNFQETLIPLLRSNDSLTELVSEITPMVVTANGETREIS